MSWHHRLKHLVSRLPIEKGNRLKYRVILRLEELETRALLSASSVTAQTNIAVLPSSSPPAFSGYTPQQIQQAYGIPSTVNGKLPGTGETIAIVDAYNHPNIAKDLTAFDQKYGLSAANLTVVNQSGQTTKLPSADPTGGWEVEESLDVEWAHAIAPGAKIVLVEANSSSLNDLLTSVGTASKMANVASMSWGAGEFSSESSYDEYFTTPSVTYVASAGDGSAFVGPEWPASSPNVLAVGGTTLNLTSSNTIASETAWSASYSWRTGYQGGGGGISSYESAPSFQSGIPTAQYYNARTTPDVAWDANPSTGVSVYDSYLEPGWGYVGGTSVGAPSWSGVVAAADQQSVANGHGNLSTSQVESALYGAYYKSGGANYTNGSAYTSNLNDITSGSNGYQAVRGYDVATGLGSPKVSSVLNLLGGPSSSSAGSATAQTTASSSQSTTQSTSHTGSTQRFFVVFVDAPAGASGNVIVSTIIVPGTSAPINATSFSSTPVLNNVFPFSPAVVGPTFSSAGNALVFAGASNSTAPQSNLVFGASGWNGSSLSWRLNSFELPAPQAVRPADNLSDDGEGTDDPGIGDAIDGDTDATGEDLSILDLLAPPLFDGATGESGDSGAAGDGGE